MSTASTKSRRVKKQRAPKTIPAKSQAPKEPAPETTPPDISRRTWMIASGTVLAIGALLRVYNLKLVPFHHDEGVNGNFLVRLVRDGFYHYDPANYHGPTLYYLSAIVPWCIRLLFGTDAQNAYGLNTITVRLVPALFGLATIWLILLLRNRLGTIGVLSAAALLAISPGAIYLSRYFIHETLFVFFTLGVVVAGLKYYESGNSIYLLLTSLSAAMLFASKETAIISVVVLVIALVITRVYLRLRNMAPQPKKRRGSRSASGTNLIRDLVERAGGPGKLTIWIAAALVVFIAVNIVFYSSFFTYSQGVYDSLKAFQLWSKTGQEAHVHPIYTYGVWLFRQESPLLFLGVLGAVLVVLRPANAFALFCALWAFGLTAAYSLIAYKTPWLDLNFIVPLALISGHTFQVLYDERMPVFIGVFAALALAVSGYQTVDLNFYNYDNDNTYYVYVYAHTRREMLKLVDDIDRVAQETRQGGLTGITIVSPDYWPLPWYLRDYSRVGYYGRMSPSTEAMIIASESQGAEAQATFGDRYTLVNSHLNEAGSFALRPGVNLLLYVRRDLSPPP